MKNTLLTIATTAALGLGLATSAHAVDTLVQLNYNGVPGFDVTGINEFDWQSSGDLVILDDLHGAGSIAGGTLYDSFTDWATNAVFGDTVVFDINAQARLNDMLANGGGSVAPATLSKDGGATGTFEITAALTGFETGKVIAPGVLQFSGITGTYEWYLDSSPDSNVTAGTGFTDGTPFLGGNLGPAGNNGLFTLGTGGNSVLRNTVTSYVNTIIEADPLSLAPLIGTTFDTLITFASSGEASVGPGGLAGLSGYTVLEGDRVFKADANSEFQGTETPVPGTLFIMGLGLMGLRFFRRNAHA